MLLERNLRAKGQAGNGSLGLQKVDSAIHIFVVGTYIRGYGVLSLDLSVVKWVCKRNFKRHKNSFVWTNGRGPQLSTEG